MKLVRKLLLVNAILCLSMTTVAAAQSGIKELSGSPYAQFELTRLSNGKYTLKADTGEYLARCNNCVPGGAYPDSAFIHISEEEVQKSPYAQWDIFIIP